MNENKKNLNSLNLLRTADHIHPTGDFSITENPYSLNNNITPLSLIHSYLANWEDYHKSMQMEDDIQNE